MLVKGQAWTHAALPAHFDEELWQRLQPTVRRKTFELRERAESHGRRAVGWWSGLAFAATFGVAAVAFWSRSLAPPVPGHGAPTATAAMLAEWIGDVRVSPNATAAGVAVANPQAVREGQYLESRSFGHFRVKTPRADLVALPNTAVTCRGFAATAEELALNRGTLLVRILHNVTPGRFRVSFPGGTVDATGTEFAVTVTSEGSRVLVREGTVVLRFGDTVQPVGANQEWSGRSERAEVRAANKETTQQLFAALDPLRWPRAQPEQPPEQAGTLRQEPPDGRKNRHRPAAPKRDLDAEAMAALLAMTTGGQCRQAEETWGRLKEQLRADDVAHGLARVADCFSVQGDLNRALATYRMVAKRFASTPAGENATYEIARLLLTMGQKSESRRWFETFVQKYPASSLKAEASYRLCALMVEAKERDQALQCITKYRDRHPQGARLNESYFLEATLWRTLFGDCAQAVAAYERYLQKGGDFAEQARSWRDWCSATITK